MFDIGDKVVYPMHGAGVITSVENKHVNNKDSKYLIVQMVVGSMIIMIPETNVEHVGLREIISKEKLKIIEALNNLRQDLQIPGNLNQMGLLEEDIEEISQNSLKDICSYTNPRQGTIDDIKTILNSAI